MLFFCFEVLYSVCYKKKLNRLTALLDLQDMFIINKLVFGKKLFCVELSKMDTVNIFLNILAGVIASPAQKTRH